MGRDGWLLSVEEVALAVSMVGLPKTAHRLMAAQLGQMTREEARARLLTAGHSLMARGWLTMDGEGRAQLVDPLARVARVLSDADFSILCSRSLRNAELSLTFHFSEEDIFAHRIERGVVHHIARVLDADEVIQGSLGFFEFAQVHPFRCSSVEIPFDLLDGLGEAESPLAVVRRLEEAGVPEDTRALLAEDLCSAEYRGSILRVEYGEDRVPRSDHGLLVLRGPERLWLLRPRSRAGKSSVTLLPGTAKVARREIATLLRRA